MKKKVVVGLSGGVDSAVSAYLLKEQGFEVIGIFMKNWEDDDDNEFCSSRQDFLDAVSVADKLNIEIEHINFAKEYKEKVFSNFLQEYEAGRTPNPDIFCNSEIKFKAFLNYAMNLGVNKIATGHYAKVKFNEKTNLFELFKAKDNNKDQSYFLYRLNQEQLSKTLFPLENLTKNQVRKIAEEIGLSNAKKKDSTGICFIGERPFRDFLNNYLNKKPGIILDDKNRQLGEHIGLSFYTIGQRAGLGIGGIKNSNNEPWFVAKKDLKNNILFVVQGHNHEWLLSNNLTANNLSWISGFNPNENYQNNKKYFCKTRYRQIENKTYLKFLNDEKKIIYLDFPEKQWAITPGQSAVIYEDNKCLGGGIII